MTERQFDGAPLAMLRRVGREALATKMIDLFLASAPGRVATIRESSAAGDLTTAGRTAHSLKPSAGQLGAVALQGICQQVEDAARDGDAATIGALLPQLEAELAAAVDWFRRGAPASGPPTNA